MSKRLLTVLESFTTRGSGVLVTPKISLEHDGRAPFAVTLRLPDGSERAAMGVFEVAHVRGALPPFAMLRVLDLTPEDVPAGTEIWTID